METGALTGYLDVAQVALYAFWAFFAMLIWYIRREDRREGYPLESDATGKPYGGGIIWIPEPKTFRLPHGGEAKAPDGKRDTRPVKAHRTAPFPGAPLTPDGDPMTAGVGPGSWAERADTPDMTAENEVRITPMRVAESFWVEPNDPDPRGFRVVGADGAFAGTVSDVWIDRAEYLARYLEVDLADGQGSVLLPITFARIHGLRKTVAVKAILGGQFAGTPRTAKPDQVTLLEEDRIAAWYGGGTLYATADRAEPFL